MVITPSLVLIVVLIALLLGSFPRWGYNNSWGYGPFGSVGVVLLLIVVLLLLGVI